MDVARRVDEAFAVMLAVAEAAPSVTASDASCDAFVVTGVGGSFGPAKHLVALLEAGGRRARYLPLSAFAGGPPATRGDEALCVVSQGLSPNARLALGHAEAFREAYLVTAVPEGDPRVSAFEARGGRVLAHPPFEERGTLLRVVGPAAALGAVGAFAGERLEASERSALESARRAARVKARALSTEELARPCVLVTSGENRAIAEGLGLKWVEGLGRPMPPSWDVLELSHGPFHAFYGEAMLLVGLGPPSPLDDALEQMLVPSRHTFVRLGVDLSRHVSRLAAELSANELLLASLRAWPRDLTAWPSMGKDEPLYGLGR
jgi:creatinine amidohydrolase